MAKKDIWEHSVTIYNTLTQKDNFILIEIAKENNLTPRRVIEKLLEESATFKQKQKELENKGWFNMDT